MISFKHILKIFEEVGFHGKNGWSVGSPPTTFILTWNDQDGRTVYVYINDTSFPPLTVDLKNKGFFTSFNIGVSIHNKENMLFNHSKVAIYYYDTTDNDIELKRAIEKVKKEIIDQFEKYNHD